MATSELAVVLQNAQSTDAGVRQECEKKLSEWEAKDLPSFVSGLCDVLNDAALRAEVRALAGIILKNTVASNDEQRRIFLERRWLMLNPVVRNNVRMKLVSSLTSSVKEARSSSSIAVAKFAGIDLPRNEWVDLIDHLLQNVHAPAEEGVRASLFETLGYICEEVPIVVQKKGMEILHVISLCFTTPDCPLMVTAAAVKTLENSLPYVETIMMDKAKRDFIVNMICTACESADKTVQLHGFLALVRLGSCYYERLLDYYEHIFAITMKHISSEQEQVGLQAIEFWNTICEVELSNVSVNEEAVSRGKEPVAATLNVINTLLPRLLPVLVECMTHQSEEVGDDTMNLAMAAATCLTYAAQVCHDTIASLITPFIRERINDPNWRLRDAAVMCFGCILDGPSMETLAPLIVSGFSLLLDRMQDDSPNVRDTTAWTIGRICQFAPQTLSPEMVAVLMNAFEYGLGQDSHIAYLSCWAVHQLSNSISQLTSPDATSSTLSPYFERLVRALLVVTDRRDADEHNLLASAYEAINVLIENATPDNLGSIEQLFPIVVDKLQKSLTLTTTFDSKILDLQALLCSCLNVCTIKLSEKITIPIADNLMTILLNVLRSQHTAIHEEALMAIGSIIGAVKGGFAKYMEPLKGFLFLALRNVTDFNLNSVAVGVVGSLVHALGHEIIPYSDEIVTIFIENLDNTNLERSVKPRILQTFGDLAMATNGFFKRYLPYLMPILVTASGVQVDVSDSDNVEFLNNLRVSVLEAYSGIVNGLNEVNEAKFFAEYLSHVTGFLDLIAGDPETDFEVLRTAVGLIGDIAASMPESAVPLLRHGCTKTLLDQALSSGELQVQESAKWAQNLIERVRVY